MCSGRLQFNKMMQTFNLLLIISNVILLCSAHDFHCTTTLRAGWTTYSVPEFSASDCYYWWSNGTKHVLANHAEEPKYPVVNGSSTSLTTNECLETVYYMRDCISEGTPREASCTTACSGNVGLLHSDRVIRNYWTGGAVAFTLVLMVLIILHVSCGKPEHA